MTSEDSYLSVTALTRHVKRIIDRDQQLRQVWVRGEISNFKHHSRGHMYFTLKDNKARVSAVMFAGKNRFLKFKPESGMKVLIRGEVSVYSPYGQYQLYAAEMQPDGIGSLYLAYEELKKKLDKEGLFSSLYKKPLPQIPTEIGVITSPTGAAIKDMVTTIKRRFPTARLTLFPAVVQGEASKQSLVDALLRADQLSYLDVVIIGRGGGSIEDLWSFNEESVARQIFAAKTPIISAVGHETDFTIADFVADERTPTPTGAGELAVPHVDELSDRIKHLQIRMTRHMKASVLSQRQRLQHLQSAYAFRYPYHLIQQKEQELDRMLERLQKDMQSHTQAKHTRFDHLAVRLKNNHPYSKVKAAEEQRQQRAKQMVREMQTIVEQKQLLFQQLAGKLHTLSPLQVMERGFNLTYTEDKQLVKSIAQVRAGDLVNVRLKDGRMDCHVWGIKEDESHVSRRNESE